ncbi:hypothetical protein PQQ51_15160 [Paraburkholderia xenovorans]|uniref:hypothetical protein n=1 Tax=Paraburkholderia xenovorans TaxID=36873 RepID=UPI0038B7C98E
MQEVSELARVAGLMIVLNGRVGREEYRSVLTREAKGVAEYPKTSAGRRDARLLRPAIKALAEHKPLTFLVDLDGPIFLRSAHERFQDRIGSGA